jgi:hypothetical protein
MARVTGTKSVIVNGDQTVAAPSGDINLITSSTGKISIGSLSTASVIIKSTSSAALSANVGNPTSIPYDPDNVYDTSSHRVVASVYIPGGVGIEKDLNVGGFIYGRITLANTSSQLIISTATELNQTFYPVFTDDIGGNGAYLYGDNTNNGFKYNPYLGKLTTDRVLVDSTDTSTATDNGAFVVSGGAGIGGDINVGGSGFFSQDLAANNVYPNVDKTGQIGQEGAGWAEAYVDSLYSKFIGSTGSNLTIAPGTGQTDIFGDLRVRGANPIGTAPVVTNVLYVTMDGNDTNDGRAQDSSRACRTIGGAINSPYYQPGTQIRVSPGHYLEDNPLQLKPYTSIMGSDLRTTSIEPINKTQDLFHMNSGCYLNYMQFLNGRSGLLEGPYAPEFNRGAYCTAFPPLPEDEKIDVFHSPYIQNCTNLSGPWLKDGTLFVPDQTVQIPAAVGTGTWAVNTTTLVVTVSTGTITAGMSINAGQQNPGFFNARTLMLANKPYLQEQVIEYINRQISTATISSIWYNFSYNQEKCKRDVGILVENVAYDAAFGGNEKAVESGLAYYNGVVSVIAGQEQQTTDAIEYLKHRCLEVILNTTCTNTTSTTAQQIFNKNLIGGGISTSSISSLFAIVTATIADPNNSPDVYKSTGPDAAFVSAEVLMQANRSFIQEDTINWISFNYPSFAYNTAKCYRDVGLIIDAVSQDILLGGNQKSIEAGKSYWSAGYNYVAGQETTTTLAISFAKDLALKVIANTPITAQTGTTATQVINTFFQYGGDYMPQQAVARNFTIVTDIITSGVSAAPPVYAGGGLFALTGINGADVKLAPTVTTVTNVGNVYTVGISTATIGFGNNATLYFGDTYVFPKQDDEVEELSLEYTGNASTWNSRKVDPVGAMGGSLVDGAVVSNRSPIQSFVYDAFTQLPQGGKGIHITNNGYAQLVSVFTIFCSTAVEVDNGGIASITNSNSNFGDLCLVAKGYGKREFSGTVFNPPFRAYPFSPGVDGLDQYYPNGFWPNRGTVEVFVPDTDNRPHIALVMEVVPPDGHVNEQTLPGFLNAQPSTGTLTTSTIVLHNIDTTDIAVGNTLYIRDQYGREYDDNGKWYAATGTVVTDVGYNSITLNLALTSGGGDPTNPNYFTLYFCGNSYYTVLSSNVASQPYAPNSSVLSSNSNPMYQGPVTTQVAAHIDTIQHLNSVVDQIIDNQSVVVTVGNTATQTTLPLVTGGSGSQSFIDNRFQIITNIIGAATLTAAEAIVPVKNRTKTGTIPSGAGSAITLIKANILFLIEEVKAYVHSVHSSVFTGLTQAQIDYIDEKCSRDTRIILDRLIYDIESGGNYNSVYAGLSYWSRAGTHHIVELGEAVTRTDLFPDGATVNFYQRSYISASGYLFEYVGAGTNYGSLPQVGRTDPVQSKEVVQLDGGKVFFTSTDQNGDFRIGKGLVISQATGVLSGRTFVQSLYANMTPFILAIEG